MNRSHRIALLIAGVAVTASAQAASADIRVHIGGGARVHIGGGPVRAHWVRPWRQVYHPRPVIRIGGSIWLGGGYYSQPFAQPPPPPPPPAESCNCEAPNAYYPIAPAPVTYAVAAPVEVVERPLPRWGLGAYLGGVSVDGEHEGKDVGLVGQLRLTRGLIAEAEIAKNELADGVRTDRRFMAGLQYELSPRNKLSPYAAAAIGVTQVEIGDNEWQDNQSVAEIGGGLRLRLGDRLQVFGDFRFGQRQMIDDGKDTPIATDVGTTARAAMPADEERITRVRFGGMLMF